MSEKLLERLEAHPELKKYVEEVLDIAEDVTDTLKKADDAYPSNLDRWTGKDHS